MRAFKKIVSILSVFCIIALLLYGIIAMPMIAGYKPWSIKDNSLGKDFAKNSLFYYKATDFSEIETNFAIIYSNGEDDHIGIVKSVDKENESVEIWTQIATNDEGKNEGKVSIAKHKDYIVGMAKSMNFPFIGGYFTYINNHVAVIILMGVILALRITFIYVDPDKNTAKKAEETESFEQRFDSVLKKEKAPASDVHTIFNENKQTEAVTEESEPVIEEIAVEPVNEVMEEAEPVKIKDINTSSVPNANDITNYINDLAFDSKDDAWYKADQVDEALDMITAKVYSAFSSFTDSEMDAQLDKLREQNAETEKKYLTTEAELAKANEEIENYEKQIEDYKKQIENYKLMEQKVAKLVAAIRENKRNG